MSYYNSGDYENYEPASEFALSIQELVKEEVKATIAGTFAELEQLKKSYERLSKEKHDLYNKTRTFDDQMKKERAEGIKEGERKFSFGYAVNDIVWLPNFDRTTSKCEKCVGAGETVVEVLGKETKVNCPHCRYGKIEHYHHYPVKDKISTINFRIGREDYHNKNSLAIIKKENVKVYLDLKDYERDISGLFRTEEECQAYCDEKNTPKEVTQ